MMSQYSPEIDHVIYEVCGSWTDRQMLALAIAVLDQWAPTFDRESKLVLEKLQGWLEEIPIASEGGNDACADTSARRGDHDW